jgi:hypothetical protein
MTDRHDGLTRAFAFAFPVALLLLATSACTSGDTEGQASLANEDSVSEATGAERSSEESSVSEATGAQRFSEVADSAVSAMTVERDDFTGSTNVTSKAYETYVEDEGTSSGEKTRAGVSVMWYKDGEIEGSPSKFGIVCMLPEAVRDGIVGVDKAYFIADDERFNVSRPPSAGGEEVLAYYLKREQLRKIASADSIRMRVGRAKKIGPLGGAFQEGAKAVYNKVAQIKEGNASKSPQG